MLPLFPICHYSALPPSFLLLSRSFHRSHLSSLRCTHYMGWYRRQCFHIHSLSHWVLSPPPLFVIEAMSGPFCIPNLTFFRLTRSALCHLFYPHFISLGRLTYIPHAAIVQLKDPIRWSKSCSSSDVCQSQESYLKPTTL
ncbi:hypothetical protein BJX62DRAFT_28725 [Aspergillus germanicus]